MRKEERNMKMAGELMKEFEEMQKIVPDTEDITPFSTSTRLCNALLTIYCC